jgi:hypothetical protein
MLSLDPQQIDLQLNPQMEVLVFNNVDHINTLHRSFKAFLIFMSGIQMVDLCSKVKWSGLQM